MAGNTQPKYQGLVGPLEDLTFRPSSQVSLGVELELQILDRETADLAPGAMRILQACEEEGIEGVTGEFLLSMIEVKTEICQNVDEVRRTMVPQLARLRKVANSLGYDLAIGGTHPFGRAIMSAIFPDERYRRIHAQQGWLAYEEAVFGLHVHVGVPDGESAIGVINLLVEYIPHLLGISANSAFWRGIDTGYASSRARMFQPTAQTGIPPMFESWKDFCKYCEVMNSAHAIQGTKDIYWDIRPRPHLGTIEFRIFDAPPTLQLITGLTALVRTLVMDCLRQLKEQPGLSTTDSHRFWLARENRWRACRYGIRAECARRPFEPAISLADDTADLIKRLLPIAEEHGEANYLRDVQAALTAEMGADRQRRIYRQTGNWQPVVDDMKNRWLHELDEAASNVANNSANTASNGAVNESKASQPQTSNESSVDTPRPESATPEEHPVTT